MNIFSFRYQAGMLCLLMNKAGEGDGGGGAGAGSGGGQGGSGGAGSGGNAGGGNADLAKTVEALQKSNEALLARLEKMEKGAGGGSDDPDLRAKAEAERKAKEQKDAEAKSLEQAIRFNLGARDWLKTNGSLLPKDVEGILNAADKETYGSAIEKDSAIKSGVVQAFFSVQSNLDLLTPSQKSAIEEFLKLTKTGKQEKAQQMYESIFEPTFEMLKRIKKAEQLGQAGHSTSTDADVAYRDRMMKLSKKHYLGEKADA